MKLSDRSKQIRRDTIALSKAHGGYHYGGSFSCVEILIALYDHVLKPEDKFVLSKGHGCWPLYVLLRERGLNPRLEGHPYRDPANGIEWTTGSLGHGLPAAIGMALARKIKKRPDRIFVLMSDGECQEGTTWESLLLASRHALDNLTVVVDWNEIQGSGRTYEISGLTMEAFGNAARGLGWNVSEEVDGHDPRQLIEELQTKWTPAMILARTIKGKGVSFMADDPA